MQIHFTSREKEILELVGQALMRKTIADRLNISIHTVDAHLRNIHLKTNTTTYNELMLFISKGKKSKRK